MGCLVTTLPAAARRGKSERPLERKPEDGPPGWRAEAACGYQTVGPRWLLFLSRSVEATEARLIPSTAASVSRQRYILPVNGLLQAGSEVTGFQCPPAVPTGGARDVPARRRAPLPGWNTCRTLLVPDNLFCTGDFRGTTSKFYI
ncbi:hypothetical protein KM043_005472 [Ampulex compressa]|nr:hypothetical protein KM043_005472 [Ampulex compressa]